MNLLHYPIAALVGVVLAIGICAAAAQIGLSRERGFYSLMVMVIASYYVLFALLVGAVPALGIEIAAMLVFATLAIAGFRISEWIVVVALAAHGVFDAVHHRLIVNAGVPLWWPAFCLAFDVTMAAVLATRLLRAAKLQKR